MRAVLVAPLAVAILAGAVSAQDTTTVSVDTSYVVYDDSPITLPLGIGFRVPSYDRVNGLTLPWGPKLELGDDQLELDAVVSYRSNLGAWDPSVEGYFRPGHGNEIKAFVGRSTFTNDGWIRSDLSNSAAVFFAGSDARNYYRADRAAARYTRTLTISETTLTPFVGGSIERDWSTGSLAPRKSPWSFLGRKNNLKMRRPNPPVLKGRINSFIGGSGFELYRGELEAKLAATVEHAFRAPRERCIPPGGPICTVTLDDAPFTQTTLESHASFPTFGSQSFAFKGHAVLTGSRIAPPQRFAYLGGAGTLATVNLLALGGDRLLFVQGDYTVPIERFQFKYLGSPFVALRYAAGSAGAGELPPLIQNVGAGAGISFFRIDYSIDPASNRSPLSRRSAFSLGLSLPR